MTESAKTFEKLNPKGCAEVRADERAKTIEKLRSFIDKHYENIVFELKSSGKIEDANRVIDKFAEQMKGEQK